jgi:hypothetical protein
MLPQLTLQEALLKIFKKEGFPAYNGPHIRLI